MNDGGNRVTGIKQTISAALRMRLSLRVVEIPGGGWHPVLARVFSAYCENSNSARGRSFPIPTPCPTVLPRESSFF